MMLKEELEKMMLLAIADGNMDAGLYDTGLNHVLVRVDMDGSASFEWFDYVRQIDDYL